MPVMRAVDAVFLVQEINAGDVSLVSTCVEEIVISPESPPLEAATP